MSTTDATSPAWTFVEVVMLPMVFVRTGAQQLAYLWITGDHPDTPDEIRLSTGLPLRLVNIEPWATLVVRLGSPAAALGIAWYVAVVASEKAATFVGPQTPLGWLAGLYLLGQWVALLLWDPLVLALQGRDVPEDL